MNRRRSQARPWSAVRCPESSAIPTMITPEEMHYLYWLTSELWSGGGDVVEVGPWLGGSSWQLAAGMATNPRAEPDRRLHVIDNFRWRPFMADRAALDLAPDASFRQFFEQNLARWGELVVVHEAALPDDDSARLADPDGVRTSDDDVAIFSADSLPGRLSIVFVDGAKSWQALRHLFEQLLPRCVPGETVLVMQDFQNWLAYWVPMGLALLLRVAPGSLSLLHTLEFNTVTFRVEQQISAQAVREMPASIDAISVEHGTALLRDAERLLEAHDARAAAAIVALANVAFLGTKGEWEQSLTAFRGAEARWPWRAVGVNQLEAARVWLADHHGSPVPPSPRARVTRLGLRIEGGVSRRAGAALRKLRQHHADRCRSRRWR